MDVKMTHKVNELIQLSAAYYASGQHLKAIACCDQILSFRRPNGQDELTLAQRHQVLLNRAMCYYQLKEMKACLIDAQVILHSCPNHVRALILSAQSHYHLANYQQAYDACLLIHPQLHSLDIDLSAQFYEISSKISSYIINTFSLSNSFIMSFQKDRCISTFSFWCRFQFNARFHFRDIYHQSALGVCLCDCTRPCFGYAGLSFASFP
jgi:tetratricopeptide (TPR) repeat protein